MLQNITPRQHIEERTKERFFQRIGEPEGCGFTFSCKENGEPIFTMDAQKINFNYCLKHPEMFQDLGVQERIYEYTEPAKGICHCGNEILLINEYLGACECPECGQWYNLFGQELLPPTHWEE